MPISRPPLLQGLRERATRLGGRVVLAEAGDARVLAAAGLAAASGLCRPILVGEPEAVRARAAALGTPLPPAVEILDPAADPRLPELQAALAAELEARQLRVPQLEEKVRDPLYYACLLVKDGRAGGAVMGAQATTTDTLRAALRVIGTAPKTVPNAGGGLVTSCFLMILPDQRVLIYADCGVVPEPDAAQLAEIAVQAAGAYSLLAAPFTGDEPRVALLSFSTKGSASHPALDKVIAARKRLEERQVGFAFDGELQADAALVAAIGERKAPGSPVAGRANVLVFPDLNSGNIAYKLTERLAGAVAVGPLLRGLAQPIHDLSRGCSVEDILDTLAIAALDASRHESPRRTA